MAEQTHSLRSRASLFAAGLSWAAVAAFGIGWFLLDRAIRIGADASLPGLVAWGIGLIVGLGAFVAAILSAARDRGRIRVGAMLLTAVPVALVISAVIAFSTTQVRSTDVLGIVTTLVVFALLLVGTLLIVAPEKYGIY